MKRKSWFSLGFPDTPTEEDALHTPAPTDPLLARCYQQGREAAEVGQEETSCPFREKDQRAAWELGYKHWELLDWSAW